MLRSHASVNRGTVFGFTVFLAIRKASLGFVTVLRTTSHASQTTDEAARGAAASFWSRAVEFSAVS